MDETGPIVLKKRLTRDALLPCLAQWPPLGIGREACGGAHSWARRFREHGPTPTLIAPQCVTPSVKANTHDPGEAAAICDAVPRPTMRVVPIKAVAPHDLPSLQRARERGLPL